MCLCVRVCVYECIVCVCVFVCVVCGVCVYVSMCVCVCVVYMYVYEVVYTLRQCHTCTCYKDILQNQSLTVIL